jgi:hypothetical protein
MSIAIQYDLFDPPATATDLMQKEIEALTMQIGNVRRGMFQRLHAQGNLIMKQQENIEDHQRQIDQLRKMIMEMKNK